MAYTIIVNLDYDTHPHQEVHEVWNELRVALLSVGFHPDGRRFSLNRASRQAEELARQAVDKLARKRQAQGKSVYRYIRDFYGYPTDCIRNLLLPPIGSIEVDSAVANEIGSSEVELYCAGTA